MAVARPYKSVPNLLLVQQFRKGQRRSNFFDSEADVIKMKLAVRRFRVGEKPAEGLLEIFGLTGSAAEQPD